VGKSKRRMGAVRSKFWRVWGEDVIRPAGCGGLVGAAILVCWVVVDVVGRFDFNLWSNQDNLARRKRKRALLPKPAG